MKKILLLFFVFFLLFSCGVKIPFTEELKTKYELEESNLKKIQFYISSTMILVRSNNQENKGTEDGKLVDAQNKVENRIIIPSGTKCILESIEDDETYIVRFEPGSNKVLRFKTRKGNSNGRLYLDAKWDGQKGGEIDYGNLVYYATPESGSAMLLVITKKLVKTKRKDRVVKGMKV
ncbi:MAG: hypothetical protein HYU67_06155 [Flavobacteriia bacterium]|nr:hypothetical protein [Flavobacteriia bacterium]